MLLPNLSAFSHWVWGPPLVILLVGTGFYLMVILRGLPLRLLGHSLYLAFIKRREKGMEGDISHFQALMTALAATVGIGNIAGVATAIAMGGPGALFWMWMTGLFGMASKYAEALLAVHYRQKNAKGEMSGGPMYYIEKGLGLKWLAVLFAVFTSVATFGIGDMVQANAVAEGMRGMFGIPAWVTGAILCAATGLVLLGGIQGIARVSSLLVPVMIVFYGVGALWIIFSRLTDVPGALVLILKGAFTPTAAMGGFAGSTVLMAVRYGVARGIFSNESGLGSSPIAAAAAQTKDPVTQALVSMTQTFIDTIVVCSMTGLVIVLSGSWTSGKSGSELSLLAFNQELPKLGGWVVSIGLVLFAYSTLVGWSYYGEKAMEYLFGAATRFWYRFVFTLFVFVGAVAKLELVWTLADIFNGFMALPNLVALLLLSGFVRRETFRYFQELGKTT